MRFGNGGPLIGEQNDGPVRLHQSIQLRQGFAPVHPMEGAANQDGAHRGESRIQIRQIGGSACNNLDLGLIARRLCGEGEHGGLRIQRQNFPDPGRKGDRELGGTAPEVHQTVGRPQPQHVCTRPISSGGYGGRPSR